MQLPTLLLVLALPLAAQQVVSLPVGTARPEAAAYRAVGTEGPQLPAAGSQLHANARKLTELTGDRERLQKALPKLLSDAKAKMLKAYPGVDPAFGDEWEKRMETRVNVDEFLDVEGRAYENHFTNTEIVDLIAALNARKEGKPVQASAQLQQKMTSEMPAILGEIAGGNAELAVKLGSQVGGEIGKEHPEYLMKKTSKIVVQ
jgi:hypothetical protein